MDVKYEIVKNPMLEALNVFLVEMTYRSPHIHKEFEILLVLAGTIEIYSNRRKKEFHKGEMLILNRRQPHEIHALTENVMLLSVQAAPMFCKKIFPELGSIEFEKNSLGDKRLHDWTGKIYEKLLRLASAYFQGEEAYPLFCMSYLYEIFGLLLQNHPWHMISEKEKSRRYTQGERIERIVDFIDSHFSEKLLLEDAAAQVDLSASYVSHLFRENLGISFQDYLTLLRFERARRYVEQSDMSITDICLECGFSDYRYLNKIYKKQLNYTPIEYRRTHEIGKWEEWKRERIQKDEITTERILSREDSLEFLGLVEKT